MNTKSCRYFLVCGLALAVASCATWNFQKSLAVTGESLDATGRQFVQVAAVYKDGCDVRKTIPAEQCKSFAAFGRKFQSAYPTVVGLWKTARAAGDAATQEKVEEKIAGLVAALSQFSITALNAVEVK